MGDNEQDWKHKYYKALDSQEREEKLCAARLEVMQRGLARLSLAADGVDPQMDQLLAELRSILRGGDKTSRLPTLIGQLEKTVLRLDSNKRQQAHNILAAFEQMVEQLIRTEPPAQVKKDLKQFSRSMKKRAEHAHEYPGLIIDYAQLLGKALLQQESQAPRTGLWTRLFASGKHAAQPRSPAVTAPEAGPPRARAVVTPKPGAAPRDTGNADTGVTDEDRENAAPAADAPNTDTAPDNKRSRERIRTAISSAISELLDQIEVPETARDKYQQSRDQALHGLDWLAMAPAINTAGQFVSTAFDIHRQEFGDFLTSLDQRLVDVSGCLSQAEHASNSEDNRALNASVRDRMEYIRTGVAQATDLEHLKQSVTGHIEQIATAMDQLQDKEQHRDESLQEQLQVLSTRIREMELESKQAHKRLEEQRQRALQDALTRLPNREAYDQLLEHEYERWNRYRRPLTLVVGDVDNFKHINDKFGHLAGDMVLQGLAKALQKDLRKTDLAARFGGEEFVILLPETDSTDALAAIDHIRKAIMKLSFSFGQEKEQIEVTMSFGIAEFCKGDSCDEVFERADKAMYQAKEDGRNRCVVASEREPERVTEAAV
ncbi:MAG: diguanylate cyclase [Gammaproteobacteria bacterium]